MAVLQRMGSIPTGTRWQMNDAAFMVLLRGVELAFRTLSLDDGMARGGHAAARGDHDCRLGPLAGTPPDSR